MPAETTHYLRHEDLAGLETLRATFVRQAFPRHSHECYALGVIETGALAFSYLNHSWVAHAGSLNMVVPGEAHDGQAADPCGWSYRMLYIPPGLVRAARTELRGGQTLPFFRRGVLTDPALARAVLRLHRDLEARIMPRLESETRMLGILARWIRRHAEDPGQWRDPGREVQAVSRSKEIMEQDPGQDITLTDLGQAVGLSPYHLARVFKAQTGLPPHAWLVQRRVERAKAMLRTGIPIAQAAHACGFSDQSHLTRTFRALVGVTPAAWRNA